MKRKLIYLIFFALYTQAADAQVFGDTARPKVEKHFMCDTSTQLADSILSAIRTRKFEAVQYYLPTYDHLKATFDSLEIENLMNLVRVKHQFMTQNLRKQHTVLIKTAKLHKVNLRTVAHERTIVKPGTHPKGYKYAEVYIIVTKGEKRYVITFLAMKLLDNWFIGDELRFEPLI